MAHIITVIGKSNSGKTTLIEKLIPEIRRRGYRVGTIKHTRCRLDIDKKGKDSWRHRKAGADMVLVASPDEIVLIKDEENSSLDSLVRYFDDMDIVIVEGYKRENRPKIEVFRSSVHREPICLNSDNLIAFVTDLNVDLKVPVFGLDEIKEIADLIEKRYLS